jgi:hypothetical protein
MAFVVQCFPPLDFSAILGYPNDLLVRWGKHSPRFHGCINSAKLHISSCVEFTLDLEVVHEDVMMRIFVLILEDIAK